MTIWIVRDIDYIVGAAKTESGAKRLRSEWITSRGVEPKFERQVYIQPCELSD